MDSAETHVFHSVPCSCHAIPLTCGSHAFQFTSHGFKNKLGVFPLNSLISEALLMGPSFPSHCDNLTQVYLDVLPLMSSILPTSLDSTLPCLHHERIISPDPLVSPPPHPLFCFLPLPTPGGRLYHLPKGSFITMPHGHSIDKHHPVVLFTIFKFCLTFSWFKFWIMFLRVLAKFHLVVYEPNLPSDSDKCLAGIIYEGTGVINNWPTGFKPLLPDRSQMFPWHL